MADVAYALPADLNWLERSKMGFDRPGVQVSKFVTGPVLSRDFGRYNHRSYTISPSVFRSSGTLAAEWETFWQQINGGADVGYIVEPLSSSHPELVCGPITDGTLTAYAIPAHTTSDEIVFIRGIPRDPSEYTIHPVSNLFSDDVATGTGGFFGENCTVSAFSGYGCEGLTCTKVVPDGGSIPGVRNGTRVTGLSVGQQYTGLTAVRCTNTSDQNYRAIIHWYNGGSYLNVSNGLSAAVAAHDGWVVLSVTGTAPATTDEAYVWLQRNDTSGTDTYYVDCWGLCPGNFYRWFLPSTSPAVIEFDSAPAADQRVTVSCTGNRVTRCRFEQANSWSYSSVGHATTQAIRADEALEY
jgi:hypothetical protein